MDFRGKKKEIFSLKKVFLWIFGAKKRRFWALSYEDLFFLSFNSKRGQFLVPCSRGLRLWTSCDDDDDDNRFCFKSNFLTRTAPTKKWYWENCDGSGRETVSHICSPCCIGTGDPEQRSGCVSKQVHYSNWVIITPGEGGCMGDPPMDIKQ